MSETQGKVKHRFRVIAVPYEQFFLQISAIGRALTALLMPHTKSKGYRRHYSRSFASSYCIIGLQSLFSLRK